MNAQNLKIQLTRSGEDLRDSRKDVEEQLERRPPLRVALRRWNAETTDQEANNFERPRFRHRSVQQAPVRPRRTSAHKRVRNSEAPGRERLRQTVLGRTRSGLEENVDDLPDTPATGGVKGGLRRDAAIAELANQLGRAKGNDGEEGVSIQRDEPPRLQLFARLQLSPRPQSRCRRERIRREGIPPGGPRTNVAPFVACSSRSVSSLPSGPTGRAQQCHTDRAHDAVGSLFLHQLSSEVGKPELITQA